MRASGGKAGDAPEAVANRPNPNVPVKGKQWAVITGLVPIAAQVKEYRAAFRELRKTDVNLDYPRATIPSTWSAKAPVGSAADAELKWTLLDRKFAENEEANFAERAVDVIDPAFADPELTARSSRSVAKRMTTRWDIRRFPRAPRREPRAAGCAKADWAEASGRGSESGRGGKRPSQERGAPVVSVLRLFGSARQDLSLSRAACAE